MCVQPIIYCGDCGACKDGGESRVWYTMRTISDSDSAPNCCYSNGFVGLSGWGGGLAEHLVSNILNSEQYQDISLNVKQVVPEYCVQPIPDNVSLEVAGESQ